MGLPSDLPVVDHHCHLSPNGEGVEAARRFRRGGGTHLFLATQQYGPGTPRSVDEYRDQFERTIALARRVREEAAVEVYCVVAPYPVDLVRLAPEIGLAEAVRVQEAALDLAGRWVGDQRVVALGEVGRPHFAVEGPIRDAAERVFGHALEVARDAACPVVVHCEDLDAAGYRSLAEAAARCAFPVTRLVKHYARSIVPPAERAGVVPSYVARRELARESLATDGPWFWETDFLDDPGRPGAVLDLATIPRRAAEVAGRGADASEALRIPFERSIRAVYGFTPSVAGRSSS